MCGFYIAGVRDGASGAFKVTRLLSTIYSTANVCLLRLKRDFIYLLALGGTETPRLNNHIIIGYTV